MTNVTIARLLEDVRKVFSPPRRAKATRKAICQVVREIGELPSVEGTADIRVRTIAEWMDAHPQRSAIRTKSLLAAFRTACRYAVVEGYIDRNPFEFWNASEWVREDYKAPAAKPTPVRHRSVEQISRVLALADARAEIGGWMDKRLRALVYLYAFTGMRAAEGFHLAVDEVHLAERFVHIKSKPGWSPKTVESAKPIGLNETLRDVLSGWLPETGSYWAFPQLRDRAKCWTGGGPGARPLDHVKRLGEDAGVPGLTIIGFRKTLGTLAQEIGISELERKNLLRHTDVKTGDYYDEADVEISRRTVAKIPFHPRLAVAG
jgi:integrase